MITALSAIGFSVPCCCSYSRTFSFQFVEGAVNNPENRLLPDFQHNVTYKSNRQDTVAVAAASEWLYCVSFYRPFEQLYPLKRQTTRKMMPFFVPSGLRHCCCFLPFDYIKPNEYDFCSRALYFIQRIQKVHRPRIGCDNNS